MITPAQAVTRLREMQRQIIHGSNTFGEIADLIEGLEKMVLAKEAVVLQWAVDRWKAEVANRPLINVHRRTLDDTWRQVIRYAGGDPVALIGPDHDTLVAMTNPNH